MSTVRRLILVLLLVLLLPASVFYLFVFPALVATRTLEIGTGSVLFAAFLFGQLWLLIAEFIFEVAAAVFNLRRKRLVPLLTFFAMSPPAARRLGRAGVISLALMSYFFAIYAYGVLYVFISHATEAAFSPAPLSLLDGIYFSLVTAATVGYGDIIPVSSLAKVVVMSQIVFSLVYVVVLLSAVAAHAREEVHES